MCSQSPMCAHAIELIIKEKVVLCGKGIYKQDGQTLSLHEALTSLEKENINLPEKPRIQEIHDLRNTVQHKGLTPDEYTTQFYIDIAYAFFKRFSMARDVYLQGFVVSFLLVIKHHI